MSSEHKLDKPNYDEQSCQQSSLKNIQNSIGQDLIPPYSTTRLRQDNKTGGSVAPRAVFSQDTTRVLRRIDVSGERVTHYAPCVATSKQQGHTVTIHEQPIKPTRRDKSKRQLSCAAMETVCSPCGSEKNRHPAGRTDGGLSRCVARQWRQTRYTRGGPLYNLMVANSVQNSSSHVVLRWPSSSYEKQCSMLQKLFIIFVKSAWCMKSVSRSIRIQITGSIHIVIRIPLLCTLNKIISRPQ